MLTMSKFSRLSKLCTVISLGVALLTAPDVSIAQDAEPAHRSVMRIAEHEMGQPHRVVLGVNKSMVVDLPRKVRDVMVSDPKKMDAVMQSETRIYLIGKELGDANALFFDEFGDQIAALEVSIEKDLGPLTDLLARLIPGGKIKAEAINGGVLLTGTVPSAADSTRASDLAARYVNTEAPGKADKERVLNMLAVDAEEQVMLRVTVAEMNRSVLKQFGTNFGLDILKGNFAVDVLTANQFPLTGGTLTPNSQGFGLPVPSGSLTEIVGGSFLQNSGVGGAWSDGTSAVGGRLRALERNGLIRTLAEPNLTAISGETASFLAGGEFPIPVSNSDGEISVEFKPFGVGLSFTPMVLTENRISLKISTEVSEIDNTTSVTAGVLSIPGLKVRRANTVVELPSGGALVMAGLLSDDTRQNVDGVPGLKNLPVLGTLFRSRDYQRSETELVVIVTPYTVKPIAQQKAVRPDRGFAAASDAEADFLGRLNRVYGRDPKTLPIGKYDADWGFIIR